ncbi:MAG: TonB-dependent receptor [Chitinophagaceae bacterium]|nr:TonB-dependent receptor [Chitinophagaceae bacterium]
MKRICYLLGFMFCSFAVAAQSISVQLVDKNNGNTIPFAYINMMSAVTNAVMNTVQTDENGNATLIPEQYPFSIEINALGFESVKKTFPTSPAANRLTIYMSKKFSSLNEVVITGLNTPMKQKDALSMYKIITKEQIQAQGAVTLNEVMKNQLNVRVDNDNILGSSMRMQGMSGDKVKILIDGLPLNGREGGNINLSQINMNNVDRIEIIQGPMSVVYGTDALGGIINIITKTETKPFSVNVGAYYETIGRYTYDASITKRINKRNQITLGGGSNAFQGWKPISQYKIYNEDTLLYQRSFLFKPNTQYLGNFAYSYVAPSGFNVHFASDYLNEHVTNKGNLETWDPFNGAYAYDEYYNTQRSMNRLSLSGKLGKKGTWQSQNGYMLYYRTRNNYKKDMVTLTQELNPQQGSQDTSSFSDVYARGSYSNSLNRFSYTVGYDINLQYAYSLKINGNNKTIQDYAAYTNLSYELLKDKLKVQGGLRGSLNSLYNPPVIPSVNLLYTPVKKIQVRASYAEGYRAPSLKEMYLSFIDLNHHILGNENLKAESSQHFQLSTSYQAYEKENDYLQLILTGYYNNVFNGITLAPTHPEDSTSIDYTYANLSHQTNTIASVQADGQYSRLHYQVGYSYNYTFAEPGSYAAFSASEATATIQYAWKRPGLNVNVFYKLSGKQPFLQSNIDGSASFNGVQKAFQLCDVSLEKKFFDRKLQVVAGVKNVFDFQQATVSGRVSSGTHGGGTSSFLPRSFFTSVRFSIN